MSELLPLHVFPEGSLSSSVTTTVLIGVWVVAFFNLHSNLAHHLYISFMVL